MTEKKLKIVAFFSSISLFLASIEYIIPKPFPFFRFGLANIPVLLALRHLTVRHLFLLVLLKIIGQGLVNGTLASYVFLFSLSGNVASAAVMFILSLIPERFLGLTGISLAGALASNTVQMLISVYWIFGSASWAVFIPFMSLGCISGAILGYITESFSQYSSCLKEIYDDYKKA